VSGFYLIHFQEVILASEAATRISAHRL